MSRAVASVAPLRILEWEAIREAEGISQGDYRALFKWSLGPQGRKVFSPELGCVRALNQVGVVTLPSGLSIEILPKTEGERNLERSRSLLLAMIKGSGLGPSLSLENSPAALARLPLSGLLVRLFGFACVDLAKRGLVAAYEPREGAIEAVKGRFLAVRTALERPSHPGKVVCVHDERRPISPENRILATVLALLPREIESAMPRAEASFLEEVFEEVPVYPSAREALDARRAILHSRQNLHYERALELASLILEGLDAVGVSGSRILFGLFFPMELVFERFVYRQMDRRRSDLGIRRLSYQERPFYLVERGRIRPRQLFNVKPDLVAEMAGGETLILDAKWKLLDSGAEDQKCGISQGDLYQLLAYASVYRANGRSVARLVLLYPSCEGFCEPISYRYHDGAATELKILPLDLEHPEFWALGPGKHD